MVDRQKAREILSESIFDDGPPLDEKAKISDEIHTETLRWLKSLAVTDDQWLDSCPEEKCSFEKGFAQAKSGRVVRRCFADC
jgi:hypothetical protein